MAAVRAYFDSSGKSHDPQSLLLTLGLVYGNEFDCDKFRASWLQLLSGYPGLPINKRGEPYVHTADLIGGEFGNEILRACVDCLEDYKRLLYTSSVSVPLEQWYAGPFFPKTKLFAYKWRCAEWICLGHCGMQIMLSIPNKMDLQLYFDRNEDFRKLLQAIDDNPRHRARHPWMNRVDVVAAVEMPLTPEIQAIDIVTWAVNGHYCGPENDPHGWLYDTVKQKLNHSEYTYPKHELRRLVADAILRSSFPKADALS